jgi:hypothetical protein
MNFQSRNLLINVQGKDGKRDRQLAVPLST